VREGDEVMERGERRRAEKERGRGERKGERREEIRAHLSLPVVSSLVVLIVY